MKSTVLQRINDFILKTNVSITSLSKTFGIVQSTLNRQIKGDVQLSSNTIEALLLHFPSLSAEWLMRGNGDMYINHKSLETLSNTINTNHAESNSRIGVGNTVNISSSDPNIQKIISPDSSVEVTIKGSAECEMLNKEIELLNIRLDSALDKIEMKDEIIKMKDEKILSLEKMIEILNHR